MEVDEDRKIRKIKKITEISSISSTRELLSLTPNRPRRLPSANHLYCYVALLSTRMCMKTKLGSAGK